MKYTTKTIKVPLSETCEAELPDTTPRCEFDDGYYCGACAYKLGKISKEEYIKYFLYFISPDLIKDVKINNKGEIEVL